MRTSVSRVTEIFYDRYGDPVEIYPRFCVDENLLRVKGSPVMPSGIPLTEQMRRKPDSVICFWRTHALGDILLLTPIFNWLKEEFPACQIILATAAGFLGLFKYWDITTVNTRSLPRYKYDLGYYLDGIVEQDHLGGPHSYKHRLDLYCEFLGIQVPKEPVFSLPYSDVEKIWADGILGSLRSRGKPVIVMQAFGSMKTKRFSHERTMRIASRISEFYIVILVHNLKERFSVGNVIDLTGLTNVHQLTALIDCADAVVSMDSGILWIAHCTQTPVIALLGPAREKERMIYHRNYHVVNLSEMVGCRSCFERMTRCKGAVHCMNRSDENEIVAEIQRGVLKLVAS